MEWITHPHIEGWYLVQPNNGPAFKQYISARAAVIIPQGSTEVLFQLIEPTGGQDNDTQGN